MKLVYMGEPHGYVEVRCGPYNLPSGTDWGVASLADGTRRVITFFPGYTLVTPEEIVRKQSDKLMKDLMDLAYENHQKDVVSSIVNIKPLSGEGGLSWSAKPGYARV